MKYTIKQIEVFLSVAETLSLTHSAEKLFMSVPAVSKQLRNFEQLCSEKLFTVKGKQLHMSAYATQLVTPAKNLLEQAQIVQAYMNQKSASEKIIKLNIDSAYQQLIYPILRKFNQLHPDVVFRLEVAAWIQQHAALSKENDVLFITREKDVYGRDLHTETFSLMPFVFITSVDHPLTKIGGLTINHLVSQVWCLAKEVTNTQIELRNWLDQLKLEKPILFVNSLNSIPYVVESGLAVAYLPENIVESQLKANQVIKLHIPNLPNLSFPLALLYHHDMPLNEITIQFIKFLHQHL
ncbi:MAG: LysR family transcriptional regulator [Gammaproteobacteria bacterium]|nr:MAG: LysR family transcriptional regulator [Gammaproteobacteria bacterium]UTW42205.1 LysR family transcriptional regulator [bacterium SCSIO 12844]